MENNNSEEKPTQSAIKEVYGDYEVLKPIGKGKFAIVYRAQRVTDQLIVALKRISVDMIDAKARDKCLKEVGLLQSLDHPNIIKYMDSFISDNDLVIVVEWAAAGDLKRQLRKAQERGVGFEERIIWKYFSQICEAIRHMHDKRIMHRDLKPANIFLTLDGTVKVGDLGLSRELSEHTVQAHSKVGTPLYMSPEVLRGDGYDFKSDVWSLGCILYELAMLKSPFKAEGLNLYGLFQKISAGDFQPIPDNYSEELRNLVYSMLSNNSEERPEIAAVCTSAAAMREKSAKQRAAARNNANANANANANSSSSKGITAEDAGAKAVAKDGTDANHTAMTQQNDATEVDAKADGGRSGSRGKSRDRDGDRDRGRSREGRDSQRKDGGDDQQIQPRDDDRGASTVAESKHSDLGVDTEPQRRGGSGSGKRSGSAKSTTFDEATAATPVVMGNQNFFGGDRVGSAGGSRGGGSASGSRTQHMLEDQDEIVRIPSGGGGSDRVVAVADGRGGGGDEGFGQQRGAVQQPQPATTVIGAPRGGFARPDSASRSGRNNAAASAAQAAAVAPAAAQQGNYNDNSNNEYMPTADRGGGGAGVRGRGRNAPVKSSAAAGRVVNPDLSQSGLDEDENLLLGVDGVGGTAPAASGYQWDAAGRNGSGRGGEKAVKAASKGRGRDEDGLRGGRDAKGESSDGGSAGKSGGKKTNTSPKTLKQKDIRSMLPADTSPAASAGSSKGDGAKKNSVSNSIPMNKSNRGNDNSGGASGGYEPNMRAPKSSSSSAVNAKPRRMANEGGERDGEQQGGMGMLLSDYTSRDAGATGGFARTASSSAFDDDRGSSAGGRAGSAGAGANVVAHSSFVPMTSSAELMELVYMKLILLQYPMKEDLGGGAGGAKMLLTPLHFMCDLTALGGRNNIDTTSQFRRFLQVVMWICRQCGQEHLINTWDLDADTPIMLAKQVLMAAQGAGVPAASLMPEITPSSLVPGYGEKVCLLLSLLGDCLLKRRNFKCPAPDYSRVTDSAVVGVGGRGAEEEGSYDEIVGEVDDEEDEVEDDDGLDGGVDTSFGGGAGGRGAGGSDNDGSFMSGGHSMIFTAADPELWRDETNRVVEQLKAAQSATQHRLHGVVLGADSSWASHFEMLRSFVNRFQIDGGGGNKGAAGAGEDSRGGAGRKDKSAGSNSSASVLTEVSQLIRGLNAELEDHLSRTKRFENSINSASSFAVVAGSYAEIKKELTSLETSVSAITQRLEAKSTEFSDADMACEELTDKYKDKFGGGGADGGGDTSMLIKIKGALKSIKDEIRVMYLREGVVSSALLEHRCRAHNQNRKKQQQYYKKKRVKSGGRDRSNTGDGAVFEGLDDDSLFGIDSDV